MRPHTKHQACRDRHRASALLGDASCRSSPPAGGPAPVLPGAPACKSRRSIPSFRKTPPSGVGDRFREQARARWECGTPPASGDSSPFRLPRAFAAPVCEVPILRYMMSSDRIGGDLLLDRELQALFAKCQRMTLRAWRTAAEAWLIARALEKARGDRTKAARVLGVGRRKLDKRIRLLSIHPLRDGARKSGSRLRIVSRSPATEPFVRQGRNASRKSTARRTCSGARAPDGRSRAAEQRAAEDGVVARGGPARCSTVTPLRDTGATQRGGAKPATCL